MSGSIHRLIELARWAPSGDNTQPWQFEVLAPDHFVVHGRDTRDHCVYDLEGHASQLAIGALLETLQLAATEQALELTIERRRDAPDTRPTFDVQLRPNAQLAPDPLIAFIPRRSVFRRPMSTQPLSPSIRDKLEHGLPPGYSLRWFASLSARWQMARLMFANAKLRLTMREAFDVHRSIIDWNQRFSTDRVPDQALGVDSLTLKLMRWAMSDWRRVTRLNRYMAGTWAPRLQMDLAPSLMCGAHVLVLRDHPTATVDDRVEAGRAVQRLWLRACSLGLQHQPELTPLVFSNYVMKGLRFSASDEAEALARQVHQRTAAALGSDLPRAVWIGRLGFARAAEARSLRLSTDALIQRDPPGGRN